MLVKIMIVFVTAAALTAELTGGAFAFSGGVSHVVTHPAAMTADTVTALPIDPTAAIRLREISQHHAHHRGLPHQTQVSR